MRIALLSDIHFGDPMSVMAFKDPQDHRIYLGDRYKEFKTALKNAFKGKSVDYLVLMGDILDFSIAHYSVSYEIGQFFFQQLIKDKLLQKIGNKYGQIIYVPGNHDFDMWHTVEYQVNIINRIQNKQPANPLKMSVPVIIDDRKSSPLYGLTLHNVRAHTSRKTPKYGGLFLDQLTIPNIVFDFGYPNLYLINEKETVIVTHGQYFDFYWSFLGKWALKIINGDLDIKDYSLLNLVETVGINLPTSQLACSSVGQAGPLTEVILKLQQEFKEHNVTRLDTYLTRIRKEIKKKVKGIKGFLINCACKYIQKQLLTKLKHAESTRFRTQFLKDPKVKERFIQYYKSTLYEIRELEAKYGVTIPTPSKVIFGHTHQPIPWDDPLEFTIPKSEKAPEHKIMIYNTGGWLNRMDKNKKLQFCGAEMFFFDSATGFSSTSIGYDPQNREKPS